MGQHLPQQKRSPQIGHRAIANVHSTKVDMIMITDGIGQSLTGAVCPEFDKEMYYLGKLCKRKHGWGETGKTLRYNRTPYPKKESPCVACSRLSNSRNYLRHTRGWAQPESIPPITLFNGNGFTAFDYHKYSLEVYVRYSLTLDAPVHLSSKPCVQGHLWGDALHSLRENCKPNNCYVCDKIQTMKTIDSGKNAERRAKYYLVHRDAHNKDCLARYHRNPEPFRVKAKERDERIKQLIDEGVLDVFCIGKPCKNCGDTLKYTVGNNCVKCAKSRAKAARYYLKANHTVKATPAEMTAHLELFGGKCAYCGVAIDFSVLNAFEVDHFLPKRHGGSNTLSNFVLSCMPCNRSKFEKDPWMWYSNHPSFSKRRWQKILKVLGKTQETYLQIPLL